MYTGVNCLYIGLHCTKAAGLRYHTRCATGVSIELPSVSAAERRRLQSCLPPPRSGRARPSGRGRAARARSAHDTQPAACHEENPSLPPSLLSPLLLPSLYSFLPSSIARPRARHARTCMVPGRAPAPIRANSLPESTQCAAVSRRSDTAPCWRIVQTIFCID